MISQRAGSADAWRAFMGPVMDPHQAWMRVVAGREPQAVEQVYRAMLAGSVKPDEGHVLSLI